MSLKELVNKYITSTQQQNQLTEQVEAAFRLLNPENSVFGLVSSDYYQMVDDLLLNLVGQTRYDDIMWWLYDAHDIQTGELKAVVYQNEEKLELQNFDEFFMFFFENKSVKDVLEFRQSKD